MVAIEMAREREPGGQIVTRLIKQGAEDPAMVRMGGVRIAVATGSKTGRPKIPVNDVGRPCSTKSVPGAWPTRAGGLSSVPGGRRGWRVTTRRAASTAFAVRSEGRGRASEHRGDRDHREQRCKFRLRRSEHRSFFPEGGRIIAYTSIIFVHFPLLSVRPSVLRLLPLTTAASRQISDSRSPAFRRFRETGSQVLPLGKKRPPPVPVPGFSHAYRK